VKLGRLPRIFEGCGKKRVDEMPSVVSHVQCEKE